jgi:uncharacterized integral membrane protein
MATIRRRRAAEPTRVDSASPEAVPATGAVAPAGEPPVIPSTRTASAWVSLAAGMVFLVVVLVFILQNLDTIRVTFFWVHWRIPLALDLLFATVLGGLIVFTAGSLRMLQLRKAARRQAKRHERHHQAEA